MELSTAWLAWLVHGAGYELMIFASAGILLAGIDDLIFDAIWLAMRRRDAKGFRRENKGVPVKGRIAIFIPPWDGEDFCLYIGCYPNDAATLCSVAPLVAQDHRTRLVIGKNAGPTTKADNLNAMWAALRQDERADHMRFAAIVLHDAEDHVHRDELAVYRAHLVDHAMVQIPVVPLIGSASRWIGGHYGDEFAEAHGKELVVRSHLGVPIPSAGVGCAFSRQALAMLATARGGDPFRADSLTEDYEIGMLIGAQGLGACFVNARGYGGEKIVSRGSFPVTITAAVRQKSRWIAGIALAGWDHLGWQCVDGTHLRLSRGRLWLTRWMLWRDRRAPLAALTLLAAYAASLFAGAGWIGTQFLGWDAQILSDEIILLLALNLVALVWRLGIRSHFIADCYGWAEAVRAIPRTFFANIIAIFAAARALRLYSRMIRSGDVVWDKTAHWDAGAAASEPPTEPLGQR